MPLTLQMLRMSKETKHTNKERNITLHGMPTEMIFTIREKQIVKGICQAVTRTGQQLAAYYPISDSDVNELSDEVVIDG